MNAPPQLTNKMSKQAQNNNESTPIAPYSKEQGERDQARFATALGCDAEKKVSGMDYLMIALLILEEQGVADKAQRQRGVEIMAAMKANNSALRQWLYERQEKSEKVSSKANKYLNL